MATRGRESGLSIPWVLWAGILLLSHSLACAKTVPPVEAADGVKKKDELATPAEPVSDTKPAEAKPEEKAEDKGEEKKLSSTTVYIEPNEGDRPRTRSLVEASRAEKERRARASTPVAVITNKNLSQFNKGKVTVADPKGKIEGEAVAQLNEEEARWRQRGLEIRARWRDSTERVKQLELDTAGWRRRFYAENDATLRDRQIKPEWDRTLDELRQARIAVDTAKKDLATFLEEGRTAGVLPGWLREGTELEPPSPPDSPSPTDSIEPPIVEIDPRP